MSQHVPFIPREAAQRVIATLQAILQPALEHIRELSPQILIEHRGVLVRVNWFERTGPPETISAIVGEINDDQTAQLRAVLDASTQLLTTRDNSNACTWSRPDTNPLIQEGAIHLRTHYGMVIAVAGAPIGYNQDLAIIAAAHAGIATTSDVVRLRRLTDTQIMFELLHDAVRAFLPEL